MSKENRDKLFKKSRPNVRRLEVMDGEQYGKDVGVLWAAYKAGSFNLPEMDPSKFAQWVEQMGNVFQQIWLVDDDNKAFTSGSGPVGMVLVNTSGLLVSADGKAFKWASTKNKLRCSVAFLQMVRHSKKTGICAVKGKKDDLPLLHHLKAYDVLHYVGKVADNEWLFSVRGRGSE